MAVSFTSCNSVEKKPIPKTSEDSTVVFTKDSFAFYENKLIEDSLNTQLRYALATNYYADKQFDKAIEHLLLVCKTEDKNLAAIVTLGNVYYDASQYENAITSYEKALQLDPTDLNVRCDLATCYLNIKKADVAYNLLKKNIQMDNKHAQSHHNLSVVYSQMGKAKEAEEEMKIFKSLNK
ncbi:MAG: tetratricopeptide repeat protein [Bacteroidota bacterium]